MRKADTIRASAIAKAAGSWFPNPPNRGMHTSETKIIGNAIVGFVLRELR